LTPTNIRAGGFDIKLTQGVATSLHAQYSWTIPRGAWTHRRSSLQGDPEELVRLFHRERELLEEVDGGGEGSPQLRDSKKTTTTVFWGDDEGLVVLVWGGVTQEEQVIARTVISREKGSYGE
jgi:hypothetical protein